MANITKPKPSDPPTSPFLEGMSPQAAASTAPQSTPDAQPSPEDLRHVAKGFEEMLEMVGDAVEARLAPLLEEVKAARDDIGRLRRDVVDTP